MIEFDERTFESAKDFLDALRLSGWGWKAEEPSSLPSWESGWIFRGESFAQKSRLWSPLMPTAWRPIHISEALGNVRAQIWGNPNFHSEIAMQLGQRRNAEDEENHRRIEQALCDALGELTLVNEFTKLADELGFPIAQLPTWTRSIQAFIPKYIDIYELSVLPVLGRTQSLSYVSTLPTAREEQLALWTNPAIALARHHGIPVRILDWTRNPLVAAFFAANGAKTESASRDAAIAVYALNYEVLRNHVHLIETPSNDNDFLRAQSGIFTFDVLGQQWFIERGRYLNLAQSLREPKQDMPSVRATKKLVLPYSEVPELLRLLWLERVTPAHLMPTLDHVSEAVLLKVKHSKIASRMLMSRGD